MRCVCNLLRIAELLYTVLRNFKKCKYATIFKLCSKAQTNTFSCEGCGVRVYGYRMVFLCVIALCWNVFQWVEMDVWCGSNCLLYLTSLVSCCVWLPFLHEMLYFTLFRCHQVLCTLFLHLSDISRSVFWVVRYRPSVKLQVEHRPCPHHHQQPWQRQHERCYGSQDQQCSIWRRCVCVCVNVFLSYKG